MKVTMSENGLLTVSAETSTEAWALRKWSEQAIVMRGDDQLNEKCFARGSFFYIDTGAHKPAQDVTQ